MSDDRLRIEWRTRDPRSLVDRWRAVGLPVAGHAPSVDLGSAVLVAVESPPPHADRLLLPPGLDRLPIEAPAAKSGLGLVGIGVASVDARLAVDSLPAFRFAPSAEDSALGARSWVSGDPTVRLVLLEPSTEGRLAAALARHGEGPVCLYLERASSVTVARPTTPEGTGTSPFGRPATLLPTGHRWGPYLLLLSSPG